MNQRELDSLITKVWHENPKLKKLCASLPNFKRSDVRICDCQAVYDTVKGGFFTIEEERPKIDICKEHFHDIESIAELLVHVVTHVYDCDVLKLDLRNSKDDLLRSELRAYKAAGGVCRL